MLEKHLLENMKKSTDTAWKYINFQNLVFTTIPPEKYWFSSDHQSQAWSGEVSTWMGNRLGILRVVDFSIFFLGGFTLYYPLF